MRSVTAVLLQPPVGSGPLIEHLVANPSVARVVIVNAAADAGTPGAVDKVCNVEVEYPLGHALSRLLEEARTDYQLLVLPAEQVRLDPRALERLVDVAEDSGAGLVYSDFRDEFEDGLTDHPLIDYKPGSIRDTFDFGPAFLVSRRAAERALRTHGPIDSQLKFGGLYDLRLKLSIDSDLVRIPEPLYSRMPTDMRASGERQFDYVDPSRRDYQIEMEQVATAHLKRIGAYLEPQFLRRPRAEGNFPFRASIVIPVRNRQRTIKDAVLSALGQETRFDFNVIVVDNHSTDRTSEILAELSSANKNLVHLRPERTDLGIGGCWNEAVYSSACGEYAVQLDSDDLYADQHALQEIVSKFDDGPYAMVIGSYTIVDFDLQEVPPGLIDHREWTRDNGHNNALRINGLGAPRAFYVPLLRQIGFPNVSYGEDYAVALRISRRYEIGRIFDSIYYARRWEGNSDAALPVPVANRYDAYKDHLRSVEIMARRRMNQDGVE